MGRCIIKQTLQVLASSPNVRAQLNEDITSFWKSQFPSTDTSRVSRSDILSAAQAFIDQKGAVYFSAGSRTAQEKILHSLADIIESQRRNFRDNRSRKQKRRAIPRRQVSDQDNQSLDNVDLTGASDTSFVPTLQTQQHMMNAGPSRKMYKTRSRRAGLAAQSSRSGGLTPLHTKQEADSESGSETPDDPIEIVYRARGEHPDVPETRGSLDPDELAEHPDVPQTIGSLDPDEELERRQLITEVTFESFGSKWEFKTSEVMVQALATFLLRLSGEASKYRELSEPADLDGPPNSRYSALLYLYDWVVLETIEKALRSHHAKMCLADGPDRDSYPTEITCFKHTWKFDSPDHKAMSLKGTVERLLQEVKSHLGSLKERPTTYSNIWFHTDQYQYWLNEAFLNNGAVKACC